MITIFIYVIQIIGFGLIMSLFYVVMMFLVLQLKKWKFGEHYKEKGVDFIITYFITASCFLVWGYNNDVVIPIIILTSLFLLIIYFYFKKYKNSFENNLILQNYKIFKEQKDLNPNSEIPLFIIDGYDKNQISQKGIKSVSEISYKSFISNGKVLKGDANIESIKYYDIKGNVIESNFMNHLGKHGSRYINKYDENENLKETHSYSKEGVFESITTYDYNSLGKLTEMNQKDIDSNPIYKDIYKYDDKGNNIEEISLDGNLEFICQIINKYDFQGRIIKKEEIRSNEVVRSTYYKYDLNSNLIEKITDSHTFIHYFIEVNTYDEQNKLVEQKEFSYSDESIRESSIKFNTEGNKVEYLEYINDYNYEIISSINEIYLYDSNKNIREITCLENQIKYSFYTHQSDEMNSIYKGNILLDLKGNIRRCIVPKSKPTKKIRYFDKNGFETENKLYDSNNTFLTSITFETNEILVDSINTYDNKRNLIKEVGYSDFDKKKRSIVERLIEYHYS